MKPPKDPTQPVSSTSPFDAKQSQLKAQTGSTANRDKVREVLPVHAPRQSQRPVERSK